jgi:hypothetical protein
VADGTSSSRSRQTPIRVGAVVALALAVAFIVWLFVRGNDSSSTPKATTRTATNTTKPVRVIGPVAASPARLRVLARAIGHPLYWAGRRANVTYELTQTTDGKAFVRYLPKGVPLGVKRLYLIVATYPVKDAYKAVQTAGKESGGVTFRIARGGLAVYNRSAQTNVYFAYPDSKYQIEVYDPNPGRARQLVRSGAIRPIA